ncbi:MAG: Nramp family divalent metal transporter [Sciscionella sp.]
MVPLAAALRPRLARLRTSTGLLGPAFIAAIAYVDPGNVASNSAAGARYGYLLVWVVVAATAMAGLVQYLSAKLGLVTGSSLPELMRERLSTPWRLGYWAQAELVSMATDLAEVLGGAIGLNLLFGVPLPVGGVITGAVSTVVLVVRDRAGQRSFERVIITMLLIIAIGFVAGLFFAPPSGSQTLAGLLPRFAGTGSVLIATSMLGATVMPHAIYLHSALARDRHGKRTGPELTRLLSSTRYDVGTAMVLAGGVNLAMVLVAASALHGEPGADSIAGVHHAITLALGTGIGVLFAVGLLVSGLASTSVGCYAGSVVMGGLLRWRIPALVRRVITLVPAIALLAGGVNPTGALIFSQVVLSFGIPFAVIPLVRLTKSREVMGVRVNHPVTTAVASVVTAGMVTLNAALILLIIT